MIERNEERHINVKPKSNVERFFCIRENFNFKQISNSYVIQRTKLRSSYKERRENDLASGADEGRDKLR